MSEIALLAGPAAEFRLGRESSPLSLGVESNYGVIFHRTTGYWNATVDGATWFSSYAAAFAGRLVFTFSRGDAVLLKPTFTVLVDRLSPTPEFFGTSAGAELAYRFGF